MTLRPPPSLPDGDPSRPPSLWDRDEPPLGASPAPPTLWDADAPGSRTALPPGRRPTDRKIRRGHVAVVVGVVLALVLSLAVWRLRDPGPSAGDYEVQPASTAGAPQTPGSALDADGDSGSSSAPDRCPGCIPAAAVAATVVAISDGDTLRTDLGKVRVFGIDTPELGEPFADQATQRVEELVSVGSTVYLWRSPGSDDRDRYDRLVRTVYLPDGTDLGRELVRSGLATAFVTYSDRYVPDEDKARSEGKGMWSAPQRFVGEAPVTSPGGVDQPASGPDEPWNRPGPDLDCADIGHRVTITGPDYHRLDRDGDGVACEAYG